jgi:DNA-binding response OmpR family regulator
MAHILVIEDDEQFLGLLVNQLTQDAHTVTVAADGEQGVKLSQQITPDLIITDIIMPRKDGIETIMDLTALGSQVPIIAMSGGRRTVTASFNLQSAALMGVKATLQKPFSRGDLRMAIDKALS